MKCNRLLVFLFLLSLAPSVAVQAQNLKPAWSFGNMGGGVQTNFKTLDVEVSLTAFNLFLLSNDAELGFVFSPFCISGLLNSEQPALTFLNATVFYDFLYEHPFLRFAPYCSIHWLDYNGLGTYTLDVGVLLGVKWHLEPYKSWPFPLVFEPLKTTLGFRLQNNQPRFFASIFTDLAGFLMRCPEF